MLRPPIVVCRSDLRAPRLGRCPRSLWSRNMSIALCISCTVVQKSHARTACEHRASAAMGGFRSWESALTTALRVHECERQCRFSVRSGHRVATVLGAPFQLACRAPRPWAFDAQARLVSGIFETIFVITQAAVSVSRPCHPPGPPIFAPAARAHSGSPRPIRCRLPRIKASATRMPTAPCDDINVERRRRPSGGGSPSEKAGRPAN